MKLIIKVATLLMLVTPMASAQTISGTVVSRSTQQPVPQVGIAIVDAAGTTIASMITGAEGKFTFDLRTNSAIRIRAERFGFHTHLSEPLPAGSTTYHIQLVDSVIALTPLAVPAEARSRRLASVGLYERARAGLGTFVMREEIEKRRPLRITDVLQGRAGMRVLPLAARSSGIARNDLVMRGGASSLQGSYCFPRLYLDGALLRMGGTSMPTLTLDEVVKPEEIEGIEVYKSAAQVPPQYGGASSACGVILIWTRTN